MRYITFSYTYVVLEYISERIYDIYRMRYKYATLYFRNSLSMSAKACLKAMMLDKNLGFI